MSQMIKLLLSLWTTNKLEKEECKMKKLVKKIFAQLRNPGVRIS